MLHRKRLQNLQKKYTAKGVVWLSVVSSAPGKQGYYPGSEMEKIKTEKQAVPSAILMDPDGMLGRSYGAKTTPHMFIIGKDGTLAYKGAIDDKPSTDIEDVEGAKNYIALALDSILNGTKVKIARTKAYGCSVKYAN